MDDFEGKIGLKTIRAWVINLCSMAHRMDRSTMSSVVVVPDVSLD